MNIKATDARSRYYAPYINNIPLYHVVEADTDAGYVIVDLKELQETGYLNDLMRLADAAMQPDDCIMAFRVKMVGNVELRQKYGRQPTSDETIF